MNLSGNNNCTVNTKPKNFKEFILSGYFWKPFVGIVGGALGGGLSYYFHGCETTPCAFSSQTWSYLTMGAFWGYFMVKRPCSSCS